MNRLLLSLLLCGCVNNVPLKDNASPQWQKAMTESKPLGLVFVDPYSIDTWVNAHVKYKLNPTQWAPAQLTLARGWGDCKDIAILKYQILKDNGMAGPAHPLLLIDTGRDGYPQHLVISWGGYLMDNQDLSEQQYYYPVMYIH